MKMRDIINLLEKNNNPLPIKDNHFVPKHSGIMESLQDEIDFNSWFDAYGWSVAEGSDILGDIDEDVPTEEMVREVVAERFPKHLEKVLFDMGRKLYRGMTVTQQQLEDIIRGEGSAGVYWSTSQSIAVRFSSEGNGGHSIVMTATAPKSSVDVGLSVYLSFINFEDEDELRLKSHSPVMIHEIAVVDNNGRIVNVKTVNKNVSTGPALYGSPYER